MAMTLGRRGSPRWELRQAREACGLSQEQAAVASNVSVSTWGRWERGTASPVITQYPAIARILDVPVEQVDGWFRAPSQASSGGTCDTIVPFQDTAVLGPAGPAGVRKLAGVDPAAAELDDPVDIALQTHAVGTSNVGPPVLEAMRAVIERMVDRYEKLGPVPLVGEMRDLRRRLHALLEGRQPPRQRRELHRLAAQAAAVLGYMAVNLGKPAAAEAYCQEAVALAEHAEDVELQLWAAGTRSFNLYYQGDYQAADGVAEAAIALAPSSPQAIRLLINGRARALARIGGGHARRRTERVIEQALTLSNRYEDRLPAGVSSCISLGPYSPARTLANAVTAYVSLGDADRALELAAAIEDGVEHSHSRWSRALVRLDVASVLLTRSSPEVERAMDLGHQALEMTASAPIRSVLQRAHELADRARPWGELGETVRYADKLKEWRSGFTEVLGGPR